MLSIKSVKASVEEKQILNGISINIKPGEVHAIMGPNGSGKSTLANVLAGRDGYEITEGTIQFENQDLTDMSPDERAQAGIFLAFQYPVEIPGISNINFMNAAVNASRRARGEDEMDAMDFLTLIKQKAKEMGIVETLLYRSVNEGFSGGEKKRNEVLQMELLQPKLAILDETDSGLDIDALKAVSEGVNSMRSPERSFLIITHYQRLLDYIKPDFVHVLYKGKIIKSGDASLAHELEEKGYGWIVEEAEVPHG